jgi:hypothetical protein
VSELSDHQRQIHRHGFLELGLDPPGAARICRVASHGPPHVQREEQIAGGVGGHQLRCGRLQHVRILPPTGCVDHQRHGEARLAQPLNGVGVHRDEVAQLDSVAAGFIGDIQDERRFVAFEHGHDLWAHPEVHQAGHRAQISRRVMQLDNWNELRGDRPLEHLVQLSLARVILDRPYHPNGVGACLGDLLKCLSFAGRPDHHFIDASQHDALPAAVMEVPALYVEVLVRRDLILRHLVELAACGLHGSMCHAGWFADAACTTQKNRKRERPIKAKTRPGHGWLLPRRCQNGGAPGCRERISSPARSGQRSRGA